MELFRKIGPRVILIEHHGRLVGLVTVKDCLKYQFKAEAAHNPREDTGVQENHEKLWGWMKRAAAWVSNSLSNASGGRIQLGSNDIDSGPSPRGVQILDGDEDLADEDAVELENR